MLIFIVIKAFWREKSLQNHSGNPWENVIWQIKTHPKYGEIGLKTKHDLLHFWSVIATKIRWTLSAVVGEGWTKAAVQLIPSPCAWTHLPVILYSPSFKTGLSNNITSAVLLRVFWLPRTTSVFSNDAVPKEDSRTKQLGLMTEAKEG